MSKRTPGPWEAKQADDGSAKYWITGDRWIGQVGNGTHGADSHAFAEANSRLIAAAPDLLEALKAINEAACYVTEEDPSTQRMGLLLIGTIARDVIAKAEGTV